MELVKEVSPQEAFEKDFAFVDVRTPEEFEEFHVPGAFNVPLMTSEERKKISSVYYEKGEREARLFALKLLSPKLPAIVDKVREIRETVNDRIAVYCWRGGLRSLAVATICNLAGVYVFRLEGGYRAFRRYILDRLAQLLKNKKVFVIYGPTGTGKTRIIRRLREEGYPAVDLEGLAGHRGSVFGGIGLKQPSQKMFDSLLWREVERLSSSPVLIVEGESKRIGNLFVTEPFWKAMERGEKFQVSLPLEERVKISMEDYGVGRFPKETYLKALERIRKILGNQKYREIKELIETENYESAVRELMINYYDRLYSRSTPEGLPVVEASSFDELYQKVKEFLDSKLVTAQVLR